MHPNETLVRALLAEVHGGDLSAIDTDAYLDRDAVYQPLVPDGPTLRGSAAVVVEIVRQLSIYRDLHAEVHVALADDRHVFTERTDHVTFRDSGVRVSVPVMAVFDFTPAGRIIAWREVFDTRAAERQIGIDAAQMDAIMGQPPR